MLKFDVEPITPKLLNKKTAHSAYIKHTHEEATILRDLVKQVKSKYPPDHSLESACQYAKLIQELLTNISKTCPSINNSDVKYGVKLSISPSKSQPSGNTKKDKIQQTPSSTQKNKLEAHHRKVKSSLKNKDCVVAPKGTAYVQHSKLHANSEIKCVKCNGCMLSDNHDIPTGRTFTIVGNACPLTRITTTTEVPLRKPTALENEPPKPVVTLVYSRKPIKSKTNVPVSKSKVLKSVSSNKKGNPVTLGIHSIPISIFLSLMNQNDPLHRMDRGDYQIGNIAISRVYYIEGLGHNLFSVGQFYDSNLKVAFRQHTCFIRNLEGVDLLTGS
ncbi:hypothetical protein Tco_0425416 [Tanacetum coccineum]